MIVLIIVQILLIMHVAMWLLSQRYGWFGGRTITPIEPSESMAFAKEGIINAGLIFFVLALLSTIILGRWFCGWGCHLVLLQDWCAGLMKRLGVRPKPFRSRLLIYVPFALALYMFIAPAFYRWAMLPLDARLAQSLGSDHWLVGTVRDIATFAGFPLPAEADFPDWQITTHLVTADFWATFTGVAVAVPFLLICGFAAVYFLGSKGFCTYGCPYGGFFAPLDEFAPGRIRVSDACEQCGHCTAVCSSNVRVHEEVHAYGMVIDPGCMKCLDCVSVCPNDALRFSFGRPAVHKGAARGNGPKRRFDLSWREEIGLLIVFVLACLSLRSVYGLIPLLMAVGMALCVTYMLWKLWRMLRTPSVNLHRLRLRYKGRWTGAGLGFATVAVLLTAITLHSGIVRGAMALAAHLDRKTFVSADTVFSPLPPQPTPEDRASIERAMALYRTAGSWQDGGIGLLRTWQPELNMRMARLQARLLEFDQAEMTLRRTIDLFGESDARISSLAWTVRAQSRLTEASELCERFLVSHADAALSIGAFVRFCADLEAAPHAASVLRTRVERWPDDASTHRLLAAVLRKLGEEEEARRHMQRAAELEPHAGAE